MLFTSVPDKPSFPSEEERVLNYWKEIDAFQKQLELSRGKKAFTFYDGPPFATGLPHYGHIAAGTIKVSAHPEANTPIQIKSYNIDVSNCGT
jgi:isoleucyl-tRNA synthetase